MEPDKSLDVLLALNPSLNIGLPENIGLPLIVPVTVALFALIELLAALIDAPVALIELLLALRVAPVKSLAMDLETNPPLNVGLPVNVGLPESVGLPLIVALYAPVPASIDVLVALIELLYTLMVA